MPAHHHESLRSLGEIAVIRRLVRHIPGRHDLLVGPGDDCAVVRPEKNGAYDWLLKSDPVIEGIHFAADTPPAAIGHKALGRVLSDIAAMGGEPLWILVDVVAPTRMTLRWLAQVKSGLIALARRWNVAVVGGDLSCGPVLELHVFGVGRVPRGCAVLRSGARPQDGLWVTGTLGGSLAGKHLHFEPRLQEGCWLRKNRWATAMIDLSDGLATDLRHMLQAGRVGAELDLSALPVSQASRRTRDGRSAVDHALTDGEDFELLFTVPRAKETKFPAAWRRRFSIPCTRIGTITADAGTLVGIDRDGKRNILKTTGFEHFMRV